MDTCANAHLKQCNGGQKTAGPIIQKSIAKLTAYCGKGIYIPK